MPPGTRWDHIRSLCTPQTVRALLMLTSLAAMVLGAAAPQKWD